MTRPARKLTVIVAALVALLAAGAAGAVVQYTIFTITPGNFARLSGTNVYCLNTVSTTSVRSFSCSNWMFAGAAHQLSGSRGVIVNEAGVEVYRVTANGKEIGLPGQEFTNPARTASPSGGAASYGPYHWTGPDYGCKSQRWATDTATDIYTVKVSGRDVDVYVADKGSFVTVRGKSPASCGQTSATVGAGITGTYAGSYHYHGTGVRVKSTSSACPTPCTESRFWASHINGAWKENTFAVTYTAPGHGTWFESGRSANGKTNVKSRGDIR
jgi:hypothetical protein